MTQPSLFTEPPMSKATARRIDAFEKKLNQCDRLYALLLAHRGDWVPLPEILALGIAQFGARILELRRRGFVIENRRENVGKEVHSWYRLVAQ